MNAIKRKLKNEVGGSAFIILMSISAFLAAVSSVVIFQHSNFGTTEAFLISKRKTTLAAAGAQAIVQKIGYDYLSQNFTADSAVLETHIKNQLANITIPHYRIKNTVVSILGSQSTIIPNGPYKDMNAQTTKLQVDMSILSNEDEVVAGISQTAYVGTISLFQFAVFTSGYSLWNPGEPQLVRGRAHANGDICLGGSDTFGLRIEKLTSSNRIMVNGDSRCRSSGGAANLFVSDGLSFVQLKSAADNGCSNCDGTPLRWEDYSLSRWNGNVMDKAHNVVKLILPVNTRDANAVMQGGQNNLDATVSNAGTIRLVVDPVVAGDTKDTKDEKYAMKADIRIVNGVWYLKDPAMPDAWPGTPIWSDHPGSFTTTNEEGIEGAQAVGQSDLQARWGWATVPKRFSYYEYDLANQKIFDDTLGVISYGILFRNSAAPIKWNPGFLANLPVANRFCPPLTTCANCANGIMDAFMAPVCSGVPLPVGVGIVAGTRAGFVDGQTVATFGAAGGRILPMNFDMEQFQAALGDVTAGELGSYFGVGKFMGRDFNGIVYLTNTWQGAMNGQGGTLANRWPNQGDNNDGTQPAQAANEEQRGIPFFLCSTDLAGQRLAGAPAAPGFMIPVCTSANVVGRPNAVRFINGGNLSPVTLQKGIALVSNIHGYVLGDWNTSSNVSAVDSVPWVSSMIGTDRTIFLSSNWDDSVSLWRRPAVNRVAANTVWNTSMLSGWVEVGGNSGPIDGVNTFPRQLENWQNRRHEINGSIVQGFISVFNRTSNSCCSNATYEIPDRYWSFDPHLDLQKNQPPGTPQFPVYATESWRAIE
ncbi:MAG: hypothetical protein A4S09_01220 [Proteobacteria bacterium SG_bin7]|nr:MAG: hypothetical protein A4S09_01220 [Proteobacteria bacterium SG_bin7]